MYKKKKRVDMSELYEVCLRCGRKLRSESSKTLGYGKICFQKQRANNVTQALFDVPDIRNSYDNPHNDFDKNVD